MSPLDLSSQVDGLLEAFENAAVSTRVPDLEPFLPPAGDPARAEAVRELVRVAIELRWSRGERPDPEEYLDRFPELAESAALAEVAFEDYRQRILAGEQPDRESYRGRFGIDVTDWPGPDAGTARPSHTSFVTPLPPVETPTERIVRRSALSDQKVEPVTTAMPERGQVFAGFRLLRELGRGAFGRVYLAEQTDLADRRVALKVSPRLADEVRTLARMQHTNIVPVYSAHRVPPFTAVCMPYFGATTIAGVLFDLSSETRPASGHAIAEAVRRRRLALPKSDALPPAMSTLESCSIENAVLWIGERLADALAHAHERGIVHRDIKPANVLIADDGQPMLLDFNLASDDNDTAAERARIGGTLPYMAPEQVRLFGGSKDKLDGRADIYSLGTLLFQLLTGRLPYSDHFGETETVLNQMRADRSGPIPRLRYFNPRVTPAVESIVRKCLEPDPTNRYASAGDLRDDLARQLANLPLKFAAEPSLRERAHKWVRRHPKLVSPAAVCGYMAAALLIASAITVRLSLDARARRQDAERIGAYRQYEQFLTLADRVKVAAGSPEKSAEVLRTGSEALDRYGATEPGWEDRQEVIRLPENERERLKSEVGELAFLTARAAALIRRDSEVAIRLSELAERSLTPDAKPAAAAQRSELTGVSPEAIAAAVGNGSRGDFLRACDLAARGRHRNALPIVTRFLAQHPEDFGGWFLKARCHDVLGQFEEARADYSTSAALRPLSPRPLAARGELVFRKGKDLGQSRADLDRALQLDPNFADARLTRSLVFHAMGKYQEALADLNDLAADDLCPTRVFFARARVRDALKDKAGADADRAEGMKREPRDPASFVTRGLFRADSDPNGGLADFRAAEELDPFYADAMVNQAWLLGEKMNRHKEAIAATDRLLKLYPDHMNGRTGRAVLLARIGRTEEAIAEARRCVATAPHESAYYQAGCVFAIVSAKDPAYRDEGLKLISTALLRGFGHDFLLTDNDLDALRGDERFRKLFEGVKVMKEFAQPGSKR
jgi:serine/threonine protein kinase/Flp pilus assembly protein TadD